MEAFVVTATPRQAGALARSVYRIIRPYSTAYGLLIGLAGLVSGSRAPTLVDAFWAFLLSFSFPAGMVTFHDFVHRRHDARAGRGRNHHPGLMLVLASSLLLTSVVVGALQGWSTMRWVLVCFVTGVLYSRAKSAPLISNLVRGGISSALVMATASLVVPSHNASFMAVAVGLLDAAGNIWGDVRDVVVDRRTDVRTIAVRSHGTSVAAAFLIYVTALTSFAMVRPLVLLAFPLGLLPLGVQSRDSHLVFLILKYLLLGGMCAVLATEHLGRGLALVLTLLVVPSALVYKQIHLKATT